MLCWPAAKPLCHSTPCAHRAGKWEQPGVGRALHTGHACTGAHVTGHRQQERKHKASVICGWPGRPPVLLVVHQLAHGLSEGGLRGSGHQGYGRQSLAPPALLQQHTHQRGVERQDGGARCPPRRAGDARKYQASQRGFAQPACRACCGSAARQARPGTRALGPPPLCSVPLLCPIPAPCPRHSTHLDRGGQALGEAVLPAQVAPLLEHQEGADRQGQRAKPACTGRQQAGAQRQAGGQRQGRAALQRLKAAARPACTSPACPLSAPAVQRRKSSRLARADPQGCSSGRWAAGVGGAPRWSMPHAHVPPPARPAPLRRQPPQVAHGQVANQGAACRLGHAHSRQPLMVHQRKGCAMEGEEMRSRVSMSGRQAGRGMLEAAPADCRPCHPRCKRRRPVPMRRSFAAGGAACSKLARKRWRAGGDGLHVVCHQAQLGQREVKGGVQPGSGGRQAGATAASCAADTAARGARVGCDTRRVATRSRAAERGKCTPSCTWSEPGGDLGSALRRPNRTPKGGRRGGGHLSMCDARKRSTSVWLTMSVMCHSGTGPSGVCSPATRGGEGWRVFVWGGGGAAAGGRRGYWGSDWWVPSSLAAAQEGGVCWTVVPTQLRGRLKQPLPQPRAGRRGRGCPPGRMSNTATRWCTFRWWCGACTLGGTLPAGWGPGEGPAGGRQGWGSSAEFWAAVRLGRALQRPAHQSSRGGGLASGGLLCGRRQPLAPDAGLSAPDPEARLHHLEQV